MSAPPAIRAVSERDLQAAVIDLAERCHFKVAHFHDSRRAVVRPNGQRLLIGDKQAAGWPDLVLIRGDRILIIELKAQRGRVRPEQREWINLLQNTAAARAGHLEVYCWKPADWDDIQRILTTGRTST